MYDVRLSAKSHEFYSKAARPLARKLARCFQQLEQDPRQHSNVKPLKGSLAGLLRYRVGDHRVVYRVVVFVIYWPEQSVTTALGRRQRWSAWSEGGELKAGRQKAAPGV